MTMLKRCAVLVALLLLSPVAATAQVYLSPNAQVISTGASANATNTSGAVTLFTYSVPSSLLQGNFSPLHLRMVGQLSTNINDAAVGTVNAACNFGGTTASIMLLNSSTATPAWNTLRGSLTNAPLTIDVWLNGYAAPQSNGIIESIIGRMEVASVTATATQSPMVFASSTSAGTTAVTSAATLACTWQWTSASATNSIQIFNGTLSAGSS
jgi:hypothetical protein